MDEFYRIKRLPPYVFAIVNDLKSKARARGEDIIDLGMGNPDMPTPKHIVAKLIEAAQNPKNHRYSASRGITRLRVAISKWYRDRYGVELDPETETITTIGAKEGLAHLALAVLQPGDGALVPNPTYPIHSYSVVIADGDLRSVPLTPDGDFFARLEETAKLAWPKAKLLILSFPHNPTTMCVDRAFFEKVVDFAREHRLMVVHDFAYADFAFDGYRPPSFLEVPGAKDVGVEIFSTSKSYNMPGWRLGFVCGNPRMIHALARIKSYLDYGAFQPIQIAGIIALEGDQSVVREIVEVHRRRRDVRDDVRLHRHERGRHGCRAVRRARDGRPGSDANARRRRPGGGRLDDAVGVVRARRQLLRPRLHGHRHRGLRPRRAGDEREQQHR
jgi:alanine-synthesizing transaminase